MIDFTATRLDAAGLLGTLVKPRELFVHDGKTLRRVRLGIGTQVAAALALLVTFCWAVFATVQLLSAAPSGDVARMERQVRAMRADVAAIKHQVQWRYGVTAGEMRRLGLDPRRMEGVGGPFEEARAESAADPQFAALFTSWKKLDQLEQGTIAIPSLMPVEGVRLTSTFGVRADPFKRRAAMHAGIDLAGPVGTPVYATADGYIQRAQSAGAYGNLVEINHGRGIQTRYGHLSKLIAEPGAQVKRGDLIGLMGSTGRSTGSHLHYEVRIDGKAVNPTPFMQSTDYLASVQRRATLASAPIAQGGPVGAAQ